jgi:integrase/recombinase XerD
MYKAFLTPEEIELIENEAIYVRDKLLIRMLFHLGCRISEALALKVEDINFSQGTVTIEHLKTRLRLSCPNCKARLGKSHVFCPQCGLRIEKAVAEAKEHRRMRTVPLDSETLEMLRDYIDCGGTISQNGKSLIFGISRFHAWKIVKECAEKAGIEKLVNPETGRIHGVSPHKFRDAFAIHAVKIDDSGDGLRLLQEQLGHSTIATTMRYRKVAGEELKDWYEKLWEKSSQGK